MASNKKPVTEEERRINVRSFIIGIGIAMSVMILYVVLYFAGVIH